MSFIRRRIGMAEICHIRPISVHASPVDIEAAWLHHRFIQIHHFQDGNGRVARALASKEYIRAGLPPSVVTVARKPEYLDALDQANKGDLKAFVRHLSVLVKEKTLECSDFAKSAGEDVSSG
jgi:Fic family protein